VTAFKEFTLAGKQRREDFRLQQHGLLVSHMKSIKTNIVRENERTQSGVDQRRKFASGLAEETGGRRH
jgi:hypothetical protein